jgi:large subunit ribosomal protein L15
MIKLHQLRKHPKSTKRRKVVGRGLGSGHGTYSTRGGKGQTARSGHSKMPAAFEGGRQPLVRQLPKNRGFKSLNAKMVVVAVSKLNDLADGAVVNAILLKDKGILKVAKGAKMPKVKIVGGGKLSKKLIVTLPVTKTAKEAIQQAGGSVK